VNPEIVSKALGVKADTRSAGVALDGTPRAAAAVIKSRLNSVMIGIRDSEY
jgi:hypothetical protein